MSECFAPRGRSRRRLCCVGTRRCRVLLLLGLMTIVPGGCVSIRSLPKAREPLRLDQVPVSYRGGRASTAIRIAEPNWREIAALFEGTETGPRQERRAIRAAVARLEQIAGTQGPTHRDLGKNRINPAGDGNMDCLDESANTTIYLRLFAERGLLSWHEVLRRVHRGPLHFDTHNSAAVRDRVEGRIYVVDSWYLDNGEPPYIQELNDWLAKMPFPEETP